MEKKKYNFPEVKLGQYKGLAITRHVRPVTEKTLDIEMVHQTRMHATYRPTQEPAKRGYRALLDFAGYMDGKEIPDSRMEKVMVVLGDGKLMPAAEQAIYGHRAGETFRFDFTYPAEFRVPELSGKTAQFEINLRSVAEKHTPELTEEFAKSIGYDSLAAMRESIRAQKQKIHEEGADRAAGQRLLEMAGANIEVHIAPETLDRTADNEMKLLGERLSRSGLTVEQHCKNSHTTPEALPRRGREPGPGDAGRPRHCRGRADRRPPGGGQRRVPPSGRPAGDPRGRDPQGADRGRRGRRPGRQKSTAFSVGSRRSHLCDRQRRKGVSRA